MWAAGVSFECHGLRIGVRVSDAAALPSVVERLPPGWRHARSTVVDRLYSVVVGGAGSRPGVRRLSLAYVDGAALARGRDLETALDAFESHLHLYVAERARGLVFVHAGVVAIRGRAVLLPGRSGAGKSRLVAALLRSGAVYYSDEFALVDSRGRVLPFPVPLSLRANAGSRPSRTPAERLGVPVGSKPLPVGLVVVSRYRTGARWRPRRLSPGRGLLRLLANTVAARSRPAAVLSLLRRVVTRAPVFAGVRGDAEQVLAWLPRVLGPPGSS